MYRTMTRRGRVSVAGVALLALAVVPSAADARYGRGTLEKGDSGRDVKIMQRYLTRVGIDTDVDGMFGSGTARALKKFERGAQLKPDGKLEPSDAQKLKDAAQHGSEGSPDDGGNNGSGGNGGATAGDSGQGGDTGSAPAGGDVSISADGRTADAPADAPQEVKDAVAAANKITDKPYKYGGGHGQWEDSGYDCSGAVSYALHGAGLLDEPLDSSGLAAWGESGKGQWITVYGKSSHAYVVIGGARFDTSGAGEEGPRWRDEPGATDGYAVRHPQGL
jgi:peptidoglycan hydrolase-like protein with peptidoglycan-binding domain